jgi:hypothetical protein
MTHITYLAEVAKELNRLADRGVWTREWILHSDYNHQSWLHALVWGALVRAVPDGYVPMVDVKWKGSFRPDLCICQDVDMNKVFAVVEYESTNSSDERIPRDVLSHFREAICAQVEAGRLDTRWWLILSTLPSDPVTDWPYWGEDRKRITARNKNPFAFYHRSILKGIRDTCSRVRRVYSGNMPTKIVWANLDETHLTVVRESGRPGRHMFKLRLPHPERP